MPLRSSERPQLYSKLGSGGFGQVHRAHFRGSIVSQNALRTLDSQASRAHLTLWKSTNHFWLCFLKVAVKTIRWKEPSTPRALYARMTALNERSLLKSMKHPHIIELIDYSIRLDMQQVQLFLPYCSGGSLRSWIEDTASDRSESLKKRMIAQLMSALHYCHAPLHGGMSILHRDIKPENGEQRRMPTPRFPALSLQTIFYQAPVSSAPFQSFTGLDTFSMHALRRRYATIGRMGLRRTSFRSASQSMSSSANSKLWAREWQRRISSDSLMSITSSLREYHILLDEKVVKNADLQLELHKIPQELRGALSSMLAGPVRTCEDLS
ncbi:tRNA (cytidine(32),guanosine(34)-2'-O)-methyltransferase [Sarracenia purpurea var. burkii]